MYILTILENDWVSEYEILCFFISAKIQIVFCLIIGFNFLYSNFIILYFCKMQAPRLPSIFKSPKVRSFSFPLRYYDERKERIENLEKQLS